MNHTLGSSHLETVPSSGAALRQRAAEVSGPPLASPASLSGPQPEIDLVSIRGEIMTLQQEIQDHFGAALQKAIEIGGKLCEVQAVLKHTRCYEDWIKTNLPFKERTARDYVFLYLNKRELIENKASRDQLSIRGAVKLIRDSAKQAEHCAPEASPPKAEVPDEGKVPQVSREVLVIEADSILIAQIVSSLDVARKAKKNVSYRHFGIPTPREALWIARWRLVLVTQWQKLAQLKIFRVTANRS